jgi:hypothetical protein
VWWNNGECHGHRGTPVAHSTDQKRGEKPPRKPGPYGIVTVIYVHGEPQMRTSEHLSGKKTRDLVASPWHSRWLGGKGMASYSGVWLGRFGSINHNARDCALVKICPSEPGAPRCTHSSHISLNRVYHRSSPTIGLRIYANTVGSPKTMRTRASSWVQPPDNGIGTPLRPTIPSFQLLSLPPSLPPPHPPTPTHQHNPTHKLQNPKTHKHKGRCRPMTRPAPRRFGAAHVALLLATVRVILAGLVSPASAHPGTIHVRRG